MRAVKRAVSVALVLAALAVPQSGCSAQGMNAIAGLALSLGAAVGGYFLTRELFG